MDIDITLDVVVFVRTYPTACGMSITVIIVNSGTSHLHAIQTMDVPVGGIVCLFRNPTLGHVAESILH